ncbi:MAG: NADH-quinone oxidoreductase subunit L [Acidimicrobiia bacterium]|nr:NADH-quinone oxidoreductase subunit L [Acidimicrobiia bacterium]
MLSLIPLLPFAGFLVNATLGRRLPKGVSGGVASLAMLASFAVAAAAVRRLAGLDPGAFAISETFYSWIASGDIAIDLAFRLDTLSAVMVLVITGIGSLIHVYSIAYMHEEPDAAFARYFSYLNLFAAFMLVLVLGSSFPVMFVGWEGVGLCSYLLIGFWFTKKSASDAGRKAFVVNRVGDYAFVLGMLLLLAHVGTLDFQAVARAVAPQAPETGFGALSIVTLLLFIGATGKSAQIPLHTWLPDAMEGPTPVSALIHATTMVTAGVYMIGRNAVLFSHTPDVLVIVAVVGAATALFAGTIGLVQTDIKRVLAYSTVSQLGYMFLAMGVGAFGAGIFHLYTHAFFKALLFLGSGAVIHALGGEQDIRRMGGLRRELPITYWTFVVGALAIAGVPGLAGFFSKDAILFETFARGHVVLWIVGALTSLLTAAYMFRLVFLTFHGTRLRQGSGEAASAAPRDVDAHAHGGGHARDHGGHLHDAPPAMALALLLLALGSVAAGYVGVPHALGGGNRLHSWLEPAFTASTATVADHETADDAADDHGGGHGADATRLELNLMGVSSALALFGIGMAAWFWLGRRDRAAAIAERAGPVYRLLLNKYYVDQIYDAAIVRPLVALSQVGLWRGLDVRLIDGAVNGVGTTVSAAATTLRRIQSGSVRTYAGFVLAGVILVLGYYPVIEPIVRSMASVFAWPMGR